MKKVAEKDLLALLVYLADKDMMPARTFDILLLELKLFDRYFEEYFEPAPNYKGCWQRVYPQIELKESIS
jgi:hypothetical protein